MLLVGGGLGKAFPFISHPHFFDIPVNAFATVTAAARYKGVAQRINKRRVSHQRFDAGQSAGYLTPERTLLELFFFFFTSHPHGFLDSAENWASLLFPLILCLVTMIAGVGVALC